MKRGPKPKKFCVRGHDISIVGRNKHGMCNQCKLEYDKEYNEKNKNKIFKYHKRYNKKHKNKERTRQKQRYEENKPIIQEKQRTNYEENKDKICKKRREHYIKNREKIIRRTKRYHKKHPEITKLCRLRQHKKRKLRIPTWGQDGIWAFYENCPKNKEVDHIIPLLGRKVSGLHVRWNLQYLTHENNISKNNVCDLLEASEWYGKILEEAGLK